jgi:hypothetical protein
MMESSMVEAHHLEIDGALVRISKGTLGLFYATSGDVPGLLVAAGSEDELIKKVPAAIAELAAVRAQK